MSTVNDDVFIKVEPSVVGSVASSIMPDNPRKAVIFYLAAGFFF